MFTFLLQFLHLFLKSSNLYIKPTQSSQSFEHIHLASAPARKANARESIPHPMHLRQLLDYALRIVFE